MTASQGCATTSDSVRKLARTNGHPSPGRVFSYDKWVAWRKTLTPEDYARGNALLAFLLSCPNGDPFARIYEFTAKAGESYK